MLGQSRLYKRNYNPSGAVLIKRTCKNFNLIFIGKIKLNKSPRSKFISAMVYLKPKLGRSLEGTSFTSYKIGHMLNVQFPILVTSMNIHTSRTPPVCQYSIPKAIKKIKVDHPM
jgi:hypothetical protein